MTDFYLRNREGADERTLSNGSGCMDVSQTDEWNLTEYHHDDHAEPDVQRGMIVARMPDLGDCKQIPEQTSQESAWLCKFREKRELLMVFLAEYYGRGKRCVEEMIKSFNTTSNDADEAGQSTKLFYTRLIFLGCLIFLAGILLLIFGSNGVQNVSDEDAVQQVAVEQETLPADVSKQTPSPEGLVLVPDTPAPQDVFALVSESHPVTSSGTAESASVKEDHLSDFAAKNTEGQGISSDSPWDRPVSDGYSPWTMNSTQRLDSATENVSEQVSVDLPLEEITGVAVTPMEVSPSPSYSSAPIPHDVIAQRPAMAPMTSMPAVPSQMSSHGPSVAQLQPMQPLNQRPVVAPEYVQPQPQYSANMASAEQSGGFASTSQFKNRNLVPQASAMPMPSNQPTMNPYSAMAAAPVQQHTPVTPTAGRIPIAESMDAYQVRTSQESAYAKRDAVPMQRQHEQYQQAHAPMTQVQVASAPYGNIPGHAPNSQYSATQTNGMPGQRPAASVPYAGYPGRNAGEAVPMPAQGNAYPQQPNAQYQQPQYPNTQYPNTPAPNGQYSNAPQYPNAPYSNAQQPQPQYGSPAGYGTQATRPMAGNMYPSGPVPTLQPQGRIY